MTAAEFTPMLLTSAKGETKMAITTDYRISVKGHVDQDWSAWFGNMQLETTPSGDTVFLGPVADQAALHGLLAKVRDLGLTLIAVERVEPGSTNSA